MTMLLNKIFKISLVIILFGCLCHPVQAFKKSSIKVLYVGGSTNFDSTAGEITDPVLIEASIQERMSDFDKMLHKYFTTVKVVRDTAYIASMSDDYDVTIFDGKPKPIKPRLISYKDDGQYDKMFEAEYLPIDFSRPCIMIADASQTLGRGLGSKNDWYCLCLDADAHSYNKEHQIFKGPFKVKMTERMEETPYEARVEYSYFQDGNVPDSVMMWRVQKKGYMDDSTLRVGMVSRPWGYLDSPDSEVISSGVCAKTFDAVAIGRHGNYFHWGFAASPGLMTPEALPVFANAVVYIAEHATPVIARKWTERITTRETIKEKEYLATKKAWLNRLEINREWNESCLKEKAEAEAKKARGEKLSRADEIRLNIEPEPEWTYDYMLRRYQKEYFEFLGEDEEAYLKFYKENKPYFYGGEGIYTLEIDQDCKSWGIANNNPELLNHAITILEKAEAGDQDAKWHVEKAHRILDRYSLCKFKTTKEWRDWYESRKEKIFFSESGGWYFMVNTTDPNEPANDYSAYLNKLEKERAEAEARQQAQQNKKASNQNGSAKKSPAELIAALSTDAMNPVALCAYSESDTEGKSKVTVHAKIETGYHIYGEVASADPFIATKVNFESSDNVTEDGSLVEPSRFDKLGNNGTTVYHDSAVWSQLFIGAHGSVVKVKVTYQCCDSQICFPPVTKEIEVKL